MENFDIYEHQEQPVANQVTMDALGNTNQDIYNNPFGDFNNQFISDVAMGKATEIADLVTQQQPVCNISDTMTNNLNNINNNKFNNGHDEMEKNFMVDDALSFEQPSQPSQPQDAGNILILNDDNNNSNNDNFSGPETDVDAIDDDVQLNASLGAQGGVKEMTQMEFKETEDFTDRATENIHFDEDNSAAMYGTLENKIFEEMSLHNPDMIQGNNPFALGEDSNVLKQAADIASAPVMEQFVDNKAFEQEIQNMTDLVDQAQNFVMNEEFTKEMIGAVDELKSATNDDVAMEQQPQIDLGLIESTQQQQQQVIGESGGEESEDEWNYIEGDKKSSDNNLAAVKEKSEEIKSSFTEEKAELGGENLEKFIEQEQQFNSSIKDCEVVKEAVEEHFNEGEKEKELPLSIDIEQSDEMSQLNPDAKEFIPVSPTRVNNMLASPFNGQLNPVINNIVIEDTVVSQSPRKGEYQAMEDVIIPSEKDFDTECSSRPHEFDLTESLENREVPQLLNLKESQQRDDKLEQEYKDEAFFEEEKTQSTDEYKVLEKSFSDYSNGFQNVIDDPMNRSFYEGREGDVLLATGDVLNTVQPIPTFEDEQPEADHQNFTTESDKPEADHEESQMSNDQMLSPEKETKVSVSEDNFEAEQFVEEIKNASDADKYNDMGLSPQLPEVTFNTVQTTVDEIIKEEIKFVENVEDANIVSSPINTEPVAVETSPVEEVPATKEIEEIKEPIVEMTEQIPIVQEAEKVVEKLEQEEVKPEVVAGAAVVASAGTIAAAAATKKKPAAPKTDVKAKTTVASKTSSAPIKKAPSSTTTTTSKTPITKAALSKPLAATKKATAPLAAAPKAAPKSTVSSAATTRPKPSTTSVTTAKRPMSASTTKSTTDSTAPKTASTFKSTTLTKKPATSVAATKPLSRPASATVPSKTKLTNGSTERKPLSSSATTTRATTKPATSLASKPNGTSMTATAKPPTKPFSSTRLSTSNVEKSSSTTPNKEKLLNRSIGSTTTTTTTRSPRPTTSATTMRTAAKDIKSPSGTVSKTSPTSLTAVGVKKPLSASKKSSSVTTTTTTTAVKKVPTKTTGVKKTSTTTTTTTVVQKKKIVNGDVVSEETSTTTTSGDPKLLIEEIIKDGLASELNGHANANGTVENGTNENVQMLIDSTAD